MHASAATKRVLVIDIGGSGIKLLATGQKQRTKLPSSADLTPEEMVARVAQASTGWDCDVVSIGYPGPVEGNQLLVV